MRSPLFLFRAINPPSREVSTRSDSEVSTGSGSDRVNQTRVIFHPDQTSHTQLHERRSVHSKDNVCSPIRPKDS
jgi:hypothetical protein